MSQKTVTDRNGSERFVYTNPVDTIRSYVYHTEVQCSVTVPQERLISTDGTSTNVVKISIMGVPDGVSPYVNETLLTGPVGVRRLYIYSERPLNVDSLQVVVESYKDKPMPFPKWSTPLVRNGSVGQPRCNFFKRNSWKANDFASFIEYRYLRQRFVPATVFYEPQTEHCFNFVLPDSGPATPLAILMPENYTQTSLKRGVLDFGNNIRLSVFSKHFLVSANPKNVLGVGMTPCAKRRLGSHTGAGMPAISSDSYVSDAQILYSDTLLEFVRLKMSKMGLLNVYTLSSSQLVGYDKYITVVFGDHSNVNV